MGVIGEGRGRLLTPAEAGERMGVNAKTVWRYAREGKLPSMRLPGGHHRFYEQDVRDAMTSATAVRRPGGGAAAGGDVTGQLELPLDGS